MFVVDTEFVDTHCSAYLPVRIYQCVSTNCVSTATTIYAKSISFVK